MDPKTRLVSINSIFKKNVIWHSSLPIPNLCSKIVELHLEDIGQSESFGVHVERLSCFLHKLIPVPFSQRFTFQVLRGHTDLPNSLKHNRFQFARPCC